MMADDGMSGVRVGTAVLWLRPRLGKKMRWNSMGIESEIAFGLGDLTLLGK